MSVPRRLVDGPERFADELVGALQLDDPRKATRNAAAVGLAGGSAVATALAVASGTVPSLSPVVTLALFGVLTFALPFAWGAGDIDIRLALRLFELHRRVHEAAGEGPLYFRLKTVTRVTPWRTAKLAFGPYSLSLSLGVMAWSSSIGLAPGSGPITAPAAAVAMSVAVAAGGATLLVTWVVPPLWLLRTAGVRVFERRAGEVSRVDAWYSAMLGPVMGVAALGTLFIVYAIGGIGLHAALFSFITISVALFPIAFAATYLYRTKREAGAAGALALRLGERGLKTYGALPEALAGGTEGTQAGGAMASSLARPLRRP